MMTMVSTFLSFLAGGLPKILEIFQDRQDKKHELALVAAQKIDPARNIHVTAAPKIRANGTSGRYVWTSTVVDAPARAAVT